MARTQYDMTIIGGGSGGLTAARVAAALGANVLVVDKERLGGDCLRYGCVPSKSLIHVARVVQEAKEAMGLGLAGANLAVDMAKVTAYVQGVIERVGEAERVYTEGCTVKFGHVSFKSPTELLLNGEEFTSRTTLIATGSRPAIPQVEGLEETGYLTNEEVFDLTSLPASIVVVGGGPIGVELGQALARLLQSPETDRRDEEGFAQAPTPSNRDDSSRSIPERSGGNAPGAKITLLQGPERILPREEPEVAATIADILSSEGIRIVTGARMVKAARNGNKKVVTARQGDQVLTFEADEILLALGRRPNVAGLGLAEIGIKYDERGIKVDEYLQTSISNILAIGDVIGGYLFTHVASYQAGIAVRNALLPVGKKKVDYRVVPWCTFTDPEVARVGLTQAEAEQKYKEVRVERFPFAEIDRAQTENATRGFIKLILAGKKDEIVGAHIVGMRSGEMLGELTLAMQHNMTISDIYNTIHAYPTINTGIQQAAFEAYLKGTAAVSNRKFVRTVLNLRG
jgi:pyruvate/2-oxoglutarate dehydrogenase complex dihydrolipoamide dehydrogenase (E3) component